MSNNKATILQMLDRRARENPGDLAYAFLANGEVESDRLTFGELDSRARAIGAWLQAAGAPGEPVLLLYPPGLDFITAFFGCLYGAAIAVPTFPFRLNRAQPRLSAIARDSRSAFALTTAAVAARMDALVQHVPELRCVRWAATDELPAGPSEAVGGEGRTAAANTIAFLQYTSGSTASPRGVVVDHANLIHNQRLIQRACNHSSRSVFVSWLPVYHDLGLIGNVIQSLYVGARCILMSPAAFLQKPVRWLQAVTRYGATTSGGPDFAYALTADKTPAELREGLDLDSWEVAFNGAEPVRPGTLRRFTAAFAPCGFRHRAFYPCYGLAEATLIVSAGSPEEPPMVREFVAAELERHRAVAGVGPAARTLVGCGRVLGDQRVLIVSPVAPMPCQPGEVGEIWLSGPSVARGYWNRPEETERVFAAQAEGVDGGPFLRTGDLGFLEDEELFVTGRIKDLIIIRGRNHYPQDVELTAEASHVALRAGGAAAFAVDLEGEERLVVVLELERRGDADLALVAQAVRREVADQHQVAVFEVMLVPAGTIPKTSSGKVQRQACRARFLAGELPVLSRSVQPDLAALEGAADAAQESGRFRSAVLAAPPARRRRMVETCLATEISRHTGLQPADIDLRQPLAGLGLDSLRSLQLKQRLEHVLALPLSAADLFAASSIRGLAAELAGRMRPAGSAAQSGSGGHRDATPAASAAPGRMARAGGPADGTHPLSAGQKALWFADRLSPDGAVYNLAVAALWRDLDPRLLRQALAVLAARHPALRTTVVVTDGEPRQRVRDDLEIDLHVEDAGQWGPEMLRRRIGQEAFRPFDLLAGPLLRVAVFSRPPRDSVVVAAVHHIAADLWSLAVVLRELGAVYGLETEDAAAGLPALALDHGDYVRWQQERLAGAAGESLWAYWRQQLAGDLPALDLPTDRPRPPLPRHRGASRLLDLGADLTVQLRAAARAGESTLFATLLTGFFCLLQRYSRQDDILMGSPAAGRPAAELAGLVGYFVNPVVLRGDLAGDPSCGELLAQVRDVARQAVEHQDFPLAHLVERLQPARDPSRTPLFQVMFSLQSLPVEDGEGIAALALGEAAVRVRVGGLDVESLAIDECRAPFDLTLNMAEIGGSLRASLQYDDDLFEASTIARLLGHLRMLLVGLAGEPARPISALSLLSAAERDELLASSTSPAHARASCLPELFTARAARVAGKVAAEGAGASLTFGELDAASDRLARRLRRLGVGPEVVVGICLERTTALLVGLLGILKAGGAYLPLDPAYPAERLAFMLRDSGAGLVLTERSLCGVLPGGTARLLCLDRRDESGGAELAAAAAAPPLPGNLAYLIYTSGSTGRPKGVQVTHRALVNLLLDMRRRLAVSGGDVVLSVTTLSFDIAALELFVPLLAGARVVLADRATAADGDLLRQELERSGATLMQATPATWRLLFAAGWQGGVRLRALCGGEALARDLAQQLRAATAALWNVYGPTETTIWSSAHWIEPGEAVVALGGPIAGTRLLVLDRRLGFVPDKVAGELHIGGVGLARGYRGRPDLTAAAFVPDPYGAAPGARLYKTGDLVRRLPSGRLEFLGRQDSQVKVRGFRIELGEIEAALAAHPAVERAVVVAPEDRFGDRSLTAYVVARGGGSPGAGELREFLRVSLPEYAVPGAVVLLPQLPLTPNGKIDRRSLAALGAARGAGGAAGFAAPRGPLEETLAAIWRELLGADRVGRNDDFFALGGHSLLASRVVSRVRRALQVELPLHSLFAAPTLAQLAGRVAAARWSLPAPPLRPAARTGALPMSFDQMRLWFLHHLDPASAAYNLPFALEIEGALRVWAAAEACREIVSRHEALRTSFGRQAEQPVQWIAASCPSDLPVVDLRALAGERRPAEAERLAQETVRRPFDLGKAPLLRLVLLRLEAEWHWLAGVVHHMVADGGSITILLRELAALYAARLAGEPPPLPALELHYADYAVWQRTLLADGAVEPQRAFWRRQLAGAPSGVELPSDRPRPAVQSFAGGHLPFALARPAGEALRALARRQGVTLFTALLAGFKALLYRYSRQTDLLVGTPFDKRSRSELEGLIGLFVDTAVLRTRLDAGWHFTELLAAVGATCLGAHAHRDVPFEQVLNDLQLDRDLSRNPLFQIMFVLDHVTAVAPPPGLVWRPRPVSTGSAKFDLTLFMEEEPDRLAGVLEFATDQFDAPTLQRFLGHLECLLAGAGNDPDLRLDELPLLHPGERAQLLAEWNDTAADYPAGVCLHELFDAQAERTPRAIAVTCEESRLTYGELRQRADRLAGHLAGLGVAAESVVGVCMERSADLVVALLGVLKAGAAYLPLDPGYPPERLSFMLQDSGARVLLAQRGLESLAGGLEPAPRLVRMDVDRPHIGGGLAADGPHMGCLAAARPPRPASPDNLAYVIYTSGSTGRPKGAMITHRGICNRLLWMQDRYGLTAADRVLQKTPISFDVSVWELFWPLATGARLVLARPGGHQDSSYLVRLIGGQAITTMHFVPSMMQAFLDEPDLSGCASLRRVMSSGEALPLELQERFFARLGAELHNLYGPTEASVDVTSWRCRPTAELRRVPIGRPISGIRILILDRQMRPVPVGVAGQLHIAGIGLARGYLRRPDLTAERFCPDPAGAVPGGRLYLTGDLARFRADGAIEYLGRIDHQTKIRGHRIELQEVEAVLAQHPDVHEAVVGVREDTPGDKRLVAYLTIRQASGAGAAPSVEALRGFLSAKLPPPMVPAVFVFLAALPLTASGKVDRLALPAPEQTRPRLAAPFVAPRTHAEEVLAAVWAQVLGVDRIGIHDNFFALGGDSIRSLQVRAQAARLGLDFTLQQLFTHRTIAELAREARSAGPPPPELPPGEPFSMLPEADRAKLPADLEDAFPLAMLQQGLVFHSEASPDYEIYITSFRLRTAFDRGALEGALRALAAHHPMLRTSFDLSEFSEPLQLVHRRAAIPLTVEDWRHVAAAEQEARLAHWAEVERRSKFRWDRAPLLRIHVHRLSDEVFHCALCHPIFDGWSMAVLTSELFGDYLALTRGGAPGAGGPPEISYRDFVSLERLACGSEEARQYWAGRLGGGVRTTLPRARAAGGEAGPLHVRTVLDVPGRDLQALQRLARSQAVPLKSVLLAAHARVVSLIAGEVDICAGLIANGRPEVAGGDRVLGLFLNALPLRLHLRGGTWSDLVQELFAAEREMLPFRRYPLAELLRCHGGQPPFETVFNFTHFHVYQGLQGVDGLEVLAASAPSDQTYFPLTAYFNLDLAASRLQFAVDYDTRVLDGEQVERIVGYHLRALAAMGERPQEQHGAGCLLSRGELAQVLHGQTAPPAGPSAASLVHELIAAQVARAPDATAAVFAGESLTYRQLARRTAEMARRLRRLGAAPEVRVGICLDRSLDLLIAVLGVLEAGAAYVPMDPGYPRERLAWMLEDSRARLLITDSCLLATLPRHSAVPVLVGDGGHQARAGSATEPAPRPGAAAEPDSAAYVIFTSGSTGRPKGVVVTHRGVANFLLSMLREPGLRPADVLLAVTSLSFDIAVLELLLPLTAGARVVIASGAEAGDGRLLAEALARSAPTVMQATPATWRMLLEAGWQGSPELRVLCGGEALARDLAERLLARGAGLWNLYGPTESTVWSSVHEVAPGDAPVPLGHPIAATSILLLDPHLQPAPLDVAGEVFIGGAGVARGYVERPDLTAERFVPDPFAAEAGARLYRTGDLARRRRGGGVEFLGRIDHQVKIRGFRIELGEIEASLRSHPGVLEAAVALRHDGGGDPRLVAYVVAAAGAPPPAGELRALLRQRLPDFMLPSVFMSLPALPLTANRKVDRRALPAPEPPRLAAAGSPPPPRDVLELQLVQLWKEVLDLPAVGVADDFFELGGHSLLAVRLMARMRKRCGRDLPVAALFQARTVEKLAGLLRRQDGAWDSPLVEIQPLGSRRPFFGVHPVGGNVLCYVELARRLGLDQPFYGLQSPSASDERTAGIEDMAGRYVKELRRVQPRGPYRLGGWSMGAVIAFEMAQQLARRGEEIELLALIDAVCPDGFVPAADGEEESAVEDWFSRDLAGRFGAALEAPQGHAAGDVDGFLRALLARAKEARVLPADLELPEARRLFDLFTRNLRALRRYRPQLYGGPLVLFRASERRASRQRAGMDGHDATLGWQRVAAGGVTVHELPGDHYALLAPPRVAELGELLAEHLGRETAATAGEQALQELALSGDEAGLGAPRVAPLAIGAMREEMT